VRKKLLLIGFLFHASIGSLLAQTQDTSGLFRMIEQSYELHSSNPAASDSLARLALDISKKAKYDRGIMRSYQRLGSFFQLQAQFDSAVYYLTKSLKIAERIHSDIHISQLSIGLGNIQIRQDNFNQALKLLQKALIHSNLANHIESRADAHYSLGSLFLELALTDSTYLDSAIYHAEQSIEQFSLIHSRAMLAECGNLMAKIYSHKNDYAKVKAHVQGSLSELLAIHREISYAASYLNLGVAHWNLDEYDSAILNVHKSIYWSNKFSLKEKKYLAFLNLSDIFRDLGKLDSTIAYMDSANYLKEEIFNSEKTRNISEITEKYKIDLLNEKHQAEQAQSKLKQRNLFILTIFLGVGLLTLIIGLIDIFRSRRKIRREKQRSDELLLNILPEKIAEELKEHGFAKPRYYKEVSILFADIENFTTLAEKLDAKEIIDMLDEYFSLFDEESGKEGIEKIKTIGDAYLAVCGLPDSHPDHARKMVQASLNIQARIKALNEQKLSEGKQVFNFRMGINSGPVVAGIVGNKKFQYDIWGDAVNTAARMEQSSAPGHINISSNTYKKVVSHYKCVHRGKIPAKNKGEIDMYFVYSNNSLYVTEKNYKRFIEDISAFIQEKLDKKLFYHGFHHTMYVLKVAEEIGNYEKISEHDMLLLKTAVLLHDSGFSRVYNGHEEEGCNIAEELLPDYGYTESDIERIKGMILATKIPQTPHNLLEEIIADADLEYLGTDQFTTISSTLFNEWQAFDMIRTEEQWMNAQINFISKHHYFTSYCKKFRTDKKLENLNNLIDS
jgi:class 3 adenylate cyclase/predicted metal-dependent HD superfamily phosphohydrolase